jgi:BioD-like phosphotransacetylase family protein
MGVLYIAGNKSKSGKTALATALAYRASRDGKSVTLLKPLQLKEPGGDNSVNPDAPFFEQILPHASHPAGWPLTITPKQLSSESKFVAQAIGLISQAAESYDLVIVEGLDGLSPGDPITQASARIVETLDARVLVTVRYAPPEESEDLAEANNPFGERLLGVLINAVTRYRTNDVETRLKPALEAHGLPIVGVIPEDRRMLTPTVRDLANQLQAEFFALEEGSESLVESVMIGGWFLDQGAYVFSRRENKAVLVRGDRPDLQMAALQTSTTCLVLTGSHLPIQYVVYEAEQEKVPILLCQGTTTETMEKLHTLNERVSVHHLTKVQRYVELLEENSDIGNLYANLGLS